MVQGFTGGQSAKTRGARARWFCLTTPTMQKTIVPRVATSSTCAQDPDKPETPQKGPHRAILIPRQAEVL